MLDDDEHHSRPLAADETEVRQHLDRLADALADAPEPDEQAGAAGPADAVSDEDNT